MAWATRKPGAPVVEADNPRTPLPSCHRAVTRDEARRIAVTLTAGRVCKLAPNRRGAAPDRASGSNAAGA
jgi:hypothetical protein